LSTRPSLNQINLVVTDMDATVAFYRELGLAIEASPGAQHVAVRFSDELLLEFDTTDSMSQWDSGWRGSTGGSVILGMSVESREAVDELHERLTGARYASHQLPYDAFWGARYAIVDDPDGNPVGIMSPVEDDHKSWPPQPPPRR
jgi:predicted lactoylglutathione lyase